MVGRAEGFPTARDAANHFELAVRVERRTIAGRTVSAFLLNILRYIEDRGLLSSLELPVTTSGENYLVAKEPRHPSGRPFQTFAQYKPRKGTPIYINTNHPRFFALRQGARLLEAAGLDVSLP